MTVYEMNTAEKYDLDALVESPEMKTVLDEIREVNRAILVEMIKVWDRTPKDQIPDMEYIDLKLRSKIGKAPQTGQRDSASPL